MGGWIYLVQCVVMCVAGTFKTVVDNASDGEEAPELFPVCVVVVSFHLVPIVGGWVVELLYI